MNNQNELYMIIVLIPLIFGVLVNCFKDVINSNRTRLISFLVPVVVSLFSLVNLTTREELTSLTSISFFSDLSIQFAWSTQNLLLSISLILFGSVLFYNSLKESGLTPVSKVSQFLILIALSLSVIHSGSLWVLTFSWFYLSIYIFLTRSNEEDGISNIVSSVIVSLSLIVICLLGGENVNKLEGLFVTSKDSMILTTVVSVLYISLLTAINSYFRLIDRLKNIESIDVFRVVAIVVSVFSIFNIFSRLSELIKITDQILMLTAGYMLINWFLKIIAEDKILKIWNYLLNGSISLALLTIAFGSSATANMYTLTTLNSLIVIYIVWKSQKCIDIKTKINEFYINKEEFPISYWCSAVAIFSLVSFPLTSGFFIKNDLAWIFLNKGSQTYHIPFILYLLSSLITIYCLVKIFVHTYLKSKLPSKRMDEYEEYPLVFKIVVLLLTIPVVVFGYFSLPEFLAGNSSRYLQTKLALNITDLNIVQYSQQVENISMVFQLVAFAFVIYGFYLSVVGKTINDYEIGYKTWFNKLYRSSQNDLYVLSFIKYIVNSFLIVSLLRFSNLLHNLSRNITIMLNVIIDQVSSYLRTYSSEKLDRSILSMIIGLTIILLSAYELITV